MVVGADLDLGVAVAGIFPRPVRATTADPGDPDYHQHICTYDIFKIIMYVRKYYFYNYHNYKYLLVY